MKLTPERLAEHLVRPLLPVYVVSGDVPLLVEESLDGLRAAARRQGYTEREVFDVERGFDWGRVIESTSSMSLFASRKIVELRMPRGPLLRGGKSAADEGDDDAGTETTRSSMDGAKVLAELASRPAPDTLFIAACGALDYRQRQAGWYTALEEAGASVHCAQIPPERWPDWVSSRLGAAGLSADAEAVQMLAERTEGNALAAQQDIEKLRLLYPGGKVDGDAIRGAVADSARYDAFDLADRMLAGDAAGAARAIGHLRSEGAEPVALLGALAWTLRQWAQVQSHYAQSGDADRACGAAYVARARFPAYARALPRTKRPAVIYGWLRQAAVIDQLAKSTGGKEQAWEELLTLVLAAAGRRVMRPMAAVVS